MIIESISHNDAKLAAAMKANALRSSRGAGKMDSVSKVLRGYPITEIIKDSKQPEQHTPQYAHRENKKTEDRGSKLAGFEGIYHTAPGGSISVESEKHGMRKAANSLFENRFIGAPPMPDPQRNFMWVMVVDMSSFFLVEASIPGHGERLPINCRSVTPPAVITDFVVDKFMGDEIVYPTVTHNDHTMNLVFDEREDGLSYKLMELWTQEINFMDSRVGLAGSMHAVKGGDITPFGYTRNCYFFKLSYDNKAVTGGWVATNAFPNKFQSSNLDYKGAGAIMTVNVTLAFDKWFSVL